MKDDYGNFIGYMYSTFNRDKLTVEVGGTIFNFTYKLSEDLKTIEFDHGGMYYIGDEYVITNEWRRMEKV